MSHRTGCIEIDSAQFECCEFIRRLNFRQIGGLFRKMNESYLSGDHGWIKELPFVVKVLPLPNPFCRRHIPLSVRRTVLSSGPCVSCGINDRLTIDHIIPVSKGGKDDRENLQPMCLTCNLRKGAR